jgi:hypothetical protein
MATKLARVRNPQTGRRRNVAEIMIVNPNRKGNAMQRKKSTPNRRNTGAARKSNGHKRRNQSVAMVPYRAPAAPAANRGGRGRRHKARNPRIGGIAMGAIWGIGGSMVGRMISGFIPLRLDGLPGIGLQFGVAYGVAWLFERFTNPANAQYAGIGAAGAPAAALVDYLFGMTKTLGQATGIMGSGEQSKAAAPPPPDTSKAATVGGWDDGVMMGGVDDISYYDDSSHMGDAGMGDIGYYPYATN